MGNLLGSLNHLAGTRSGDTPGSDSKSRIGQGTGVPKTGRAPRSVAGPRSYGIRHPNAPKVAGISAKISPSEGKLPSIPKASKLPKLGNEL